MSSVSWWLLRRASYSTDMGPHTLRPRDLTRREVIVLAAAAAVSAVLFLLHVQQWAFLTMFGALTLIPLVRLICYLLAMHDTCTADALVVDYDNDYYRVRRRSYVRYDDYLLYRPTVTFETLDGEMRAVYPIFSDAQRFEVGVTYEIRYSRSDPRVFCFASCPYDLVVNYVLTIVVWAFPTFFMLYLLSM